MNNFLLLSLLVVSMLSSCDSEEEINADLESCNVISDAEVLSESERNTVCTYLRVHLFNDELYNTCECCNCLKVSIPMDCEGNALCDPQDGDFRECLKIFYEEALYLYSVVL